MDRTKTLISVILRLISRTFISRYFMNTKFIKIEKLTMGVKVHAGIQQMSTGVLYQVTLGGEYFIRGHNTLVITSNLLWFLYMNAEYQPRAASVA